MTSKSYLLISQDDYFSKRRKWKYADKISFMQSVAKYLERHNIEYEEHDYTFQIYTHDLFHAREICEHFGITEGRYFENGRLSKLFTVLEWDEDENEKSTWTLALLRDSLNNGERESQQLTLQEIMFFPLYWAVTLVIDDLIQEVYFGISSNSEYTHIDVSVDAEYKINWRKSWYLWEFDLKKGAQLIPIDTLDWYDISSPVIYSIDIYNSKGECISYTLTLNDAYPRWSIVDLLFVSKKGRLVELVQEK